MKRIVLAVLFTAVIAMPNVRAGWWDWFGDIRLGISLGANKPDGDIKFAFEDRNKENLPNVTTDNFKYTVLNPNIGLYFGFEKMLSKKFSFGVGNNFGYQRDGFSIDMHGSDFEATAKVAMSGLFENLNVYAAYYVAPKVSLNLGLGGFWESTMWSSVSTDATKGKSVGEDSDFPLETFYTLGLHGNVGVTYHFSNHWFMTLTGYYNAVVISSSADDTGKSKDSGSTGGNSGSGGSGGSGSGGGPLNPGGGGGFPGGGGGFPGGGGGFPGGKSEKDDVLSVLKSNYISNGIWYTRDKGNRATLLLTIGYRW
ncbi:MAG: hypothetical protein J6P44_04385 [Bacteroidales bacterium]|nr:hypothetical protein [Bacteroidales bacterium]